MLFIRNKIAPVKLFPRSQFRMTHGPAKIEIARKLNTLSTPKAR